jgi:hypothetical protein
LARWYVMTPNAKRDLVGGGLAVALGALLLIWLIPSFVEEDADLQLAVSFMPKLVAWLLIALGLLQLAGVATDRRFQRSDEEFPDRRELSVIFSLIAVFSVATFAMTFLPYLVVAPVFVAVLVWAYAPTRALSCLAIALLGPGFVYFVVRYVLERLLP